MTAIACDIVRKKENTTIGWKNAHLWSYEICLCDFSVRVRILLHIYLLSVIFDSEFSLNCKFFQLNVVNCLSVSLPRVQCVALCAMAIDKDFSFFAVFFDELIMFYFRMKWENKPMNAMN